MRTCKLSPSEDGVDEGQHARAPRCTGVYTPAHTLSIGGCFCVPSHLDLVDAVHVNSVLRLVCLAWIGRAAIDVRGAAVSALATHLTLRKCVVCGIAVQCPTGPTPVCLGSQS